MCGKYFSKLKKTFNKHSKEEKQAPFDLLTTHQNEKGSIAMLALRVDRYREIDIIELEEKAGMTDLDSIFTDRVFLHNENFIHDEWWHAGETLSGRVADYLWLSIHLADEEIARIQIEEELVGYEPSGRKINDINIMAFEVSEAHQGQGYGRCIIAMLEKYFSGATMTATAKDDKAAAFWRSIGWKLKPNFNPEICEGCGEAVGVYTNR